MTKASKVALASVLVVSFAAAGCAGKSARIKERGEADVGDVSRAGTETYKRLIADGVDALLTPLSGSLGNAAERPLIAFVGVENRSSEELGEFRASINNEITTALVNSRLFSMMSMRAVDAAKRESGVRDVSDLTVARPREAFLAVLNRDGNAPQYFLFGEMSSMTSRGSDVRERTYQLTLQLMDSSNGTIQSQRMVEIRKAYE